MATAFLVPLPRAVFYDANGNPLAGGFVATFVPGGTVPKTTWQDAEETTPNANPIELSADGSALIYGSGAYQITVTDSLGNAVAAYSGLTQDASSSAGVSAAMLPVVSASTTAIGGQLLGLPSVIKIAALRAATTASLSSPIYVEGYTSPTDGGEGVFWWNGNDTTSADNGGTIIVDASGRRWHREITPGRVTAKQFGAAGNGVADDSTALAAAIAYVNAVPGGVLQLTAGNYLYTGGGLSLTSGTSVIGDGMNATTLTLANTNSNGFVIGTIFTTVYFGCLISDLSIVGSSKTGGFAIAMGSAMNCTVQRVHVNNMPGGIYCQFINNCTIKDSIIEIQNSSGYTAAIKWFSVASANQVANVLIILNTTINCYLNAAGVTVDGPCQTLRMQAVGIIRTTYGLLFQNTQASTQYWPGFIYCDDVEIDGVTANAVLIEAGRNYHFTECDFFNNHGGSPTDTDCVVITADGTASVTSNIWFTSCRIAGAQHAGMTSFAKQLYLGDCYIGDNSLAGSNTYPALNLGNDGGTNGAASGVTVVGGNLGSAFGDDLFQSYGVTVAAGVTAVTISNVDFIGCVSGSIRDNTGTALNVQWSGCIDINGTMLPNRITVLSADPASPLDGMMWINEPSVAVKIRIGAITHTFTTTP